MYERLWIIPNGDRILRSESALMAETFEFATGKSTGVQTKWKSGFKFNNPATEFHLYLKLIETKGFPNETIQASTDRWLLREDSPLNLIETPNDIISLGKELEAPNVNLCFNSERWGLESRLNCNDEVRTNFAALLENSATADLKIITSDEKQLFAHKTILQVQCPVFESMFRSDLSENKTGIVNVKDVNGKTMGIFLHLFYTGELLPSWKDDDTVVGFTYAVGKYQLANVLKFLDDMLRSRDEKDSFHRDVQLLDLARKLDLKTAEKELLKELRKR